MNYVKKTGIFNVEDSNFVHSQIIPATEWVITHNLGKFCDVVVVDSANTKVQPNEIIYNSENTITIQFTFAFSGKAFLN